MIHKIVHKLSETEFEFFISGTGSGTHCRKLINILRKTTNEIDKDELYKRIFKTKRTVQNDYLLRNELSQLKRRVENFIVDNNPSDIPQTSGYYRQYVMAQWCIRNSLQEEANKYIQDARKIAIKFDSWKGMLAINKLLLHTIQYEKSDYQQKLNRLNDLSNDHLDYLRNLVAEESGYADFIKAGAIKLAMNLRHHVPRLITTDELIVDNINSKSRIAQYYRLKSLGYASSGSISISYLEKAVKFLEEDLELLNKDEERLTCMSAMAMEYSLGGEMGISCLKYELIIGDPFFEKFSARNSLMFNYCTTLLKVKEFKKALFYLDELAKLDVEPIVKERIYTMKSNCYIFLEDAKSIKKMLPKNLQSFDVSVRTYYRFLYVIYYLIKDEIDLAKRELDNIKNIRGFEKTDYYQLRVLFEKYIIALDAKLFKEKNQGTKILSLRKELDNCKENHHEIENLLPGTWIIEKSENLLK